MHTEQRDGGGEEYHVGSGYGSIAGQCFALGSFAADFRRTRTWELEVSLALTASRGTWERTGAYQVGGMKKEMPPVSMAAATTRLTIRLCSLAFLLSSCADARSRGRVGISQDVGELHFVGYDAKRSRGC